MSILTDIGYMILFFSGVTGLYVYICKKYTIDKVKELEIELSKFEDITENERELLNKIRGYLNEYEK
tara:strand:- start:220 stop:420 length:201 start_codon:yes stop_codon:yes gene_type:complete